MTLRTPFAALHARRLPAALIPVLAPVAALALAALLPAHSATAQATLLAGDHSVRGNLCVGTSCNAGVTFPDDVDLLFQNTVLRTYFQDLEGFAGQAENDWEFVFNDAGFGGQNYFALRDVDANGQVFRIQSGAPTNAFFMAADGNIGLGTSIPEANLQIEDSTTAAIRLRRNAAGGYPESAWQFAVSGAGLFIGDLISNRNAVMVLENGAPGKALWVNSNGNVGLGTDFPGAPLHVVRFSSGTTPDFAAGILVETRGNEAPRGLLTLRNQGQVFFVLEDTSIPAGDNTGRAWNFQNLGGEFRVTTAPGGGTDIEMRLLPSGDMIIEGDYYSNSQTPVPDYVFAPDYDLRPLSEVQAFIDTHSHLPDVPSAAEVARDGHNVSRLQMTLLRKVEELTLYTLEQQTVIEAERARNTDLTKGMAELRSEIARLSGLEDRLARIEVRQAD